MAITFFYAGYSKLIFSETVYRYYSAGVVLEGEPKNVFEDWNKLVDQTVDGWKDTFTKKKVEMNTRLDEEYMIIRVNRGQSFMVDVEGGSRYYKKVLTDKSQRAINGWLQVLGVLMFVSGIMGFVLERRFYN